MKKERKKRQTALYRQIFVKTLSINLQLSFLKVPFSQQLAARKYIKIARCIPLLAVSLFFVFEHLPNFRAIPWWITKEVATSIFLQTNLLCVITLHKPFFYKIIKFLSIFRQRSNNQAYFQPGKRKKAYFK